MTTSSACVTRELIDSVIIIIINGHCDPIAERKTG